MRPGHAIRIALISLGLTLSACYGYLGHKDYAIVDSYFLKADSLYQAGKIDSSLIFLNRCVRIDRKYAPAYYLQGQIYRQKDNIYNRRLSARALREATLLDRQNPEYHYSLGLTLESQGFTQNALDQYEQAAQLDSGDYRPFERIAAINDKIGLRYDDTAHYERALKASAHAAALTHDSDQIYHQAVSLYRMGEMDSSAGALYEAIASGDSAALLAQCWLLLGAEMVALGHNDSANVCFETGRRLLDDTTRAAMDDLQFLMAPKEYSGYLKEPPDRQAETLKLFWIKQDPDPTTEINERKLEHYARFVHVQLYFSLPGRHIDGWQTKRGEMYIRYGPPTSQEFSLGEGMTTAPRWIWTYAQFKHPATFIFEDTFLNGNFDFPYPNKFWTAEDYANNPEVLASALGASVPQTFTYNPGTGPLIYSLLLRQFKNDQGGTDLETYVAIPHNQLDFISTDSEYSTARVEWREKISRIDYQQPHSLQVDRNYRVRSSQAASSTLSISDRQSISAAPDSILYAISLTDAISLHSSIYSQSLRLRDFRTGKVEMSDMVLARRIDQPVGRANFKRSELGIYSNLDSSYFVGEPVWLYFEIYNLSKGTDGKTNYTIRQSIARRRKGGVLGMVRGLFGGHNLEEIATTYNGSNIRSDEHRILRLDLSQLRAGVYTITIEISDLISGQSASAKEEIATYR
jgi:GWxTD domain-containing protein